MIIDTFKENEISNLECDICIIGSGAAGITLAKELSLNFSKKVIVLETGGYDQEDEISKLKESKMDWDNGALSYNTEGTRGNWLGGTTNHWSGCSAPFVRDDFEEKPWIKDSGWPITYDDLKDYYPRAHDLLRLGNFEYNEDKLIKYYKNVLPIEQPSGIIHKFYRYSARKGGAIRFKDEAIKISKLGTYKNLTLLLHAHCKKLNFENNKKLISIDVTNHRNLKLKIKSEKFIFACGALENARILLNTQTSTHPGIGNEFDQVGRYFAEHPHIEVGHMFHESNNIMSKNYKPKVIKEGGGQGVSLYKTLSTKEEFRKKHEINKFTLRLVPRTINHPKVKSQIEEDWTKMTNKSFFSNIDRYKIYYNKNLAVTQLYSVFEQTPNFYSRVKLTDPSDVDFFGNRRILMNWQLNEKDKETAFISCTNIAKQLLKHVKGSSIRFNEWLYDFNNWKEARPRWGCHQMGTTRMGTDIKKSVVDKNCKLHNIDNVYIAGSSIFTTTSDVNPTMNIVAFSIRLASHIKSLYK